MRHSRLLRVVFALSAPVFAFSQTEGGISACAEMSNARPGFGVAYSGQVDNADYRFAAKIPSGLTGWGAGPGAPFHGFIIYLSHNACVNFEVGIDVELPEDALGQGGGRSDVGRKVKVGNRSGTRTSATGTINGVAFENVRITLEIVRPDRRDHVDVTLIAPVSEKAEAEAKLQEFIDRLRFM